MDGKSPPPSESKDGPRDMLECGGREQKGGVQGVEGGAAEDKRRRGTHLFQLLFKGKDGAACLFRYMRIAANAHQAYDNLPVHRVTKRAIECTCRINVSQSL